MVGISLDREGLRNALRLLLGTGRSNLATSLRKAGVYVWTNLITGEQLVGSSMNLAVRLGYYLKPSVLLNDSRPFFIHLRQYKLSDFKLEVYLIQDGYTTEELEHLLTLVLALEQWYILVLASKLNSIKVAGSTPNQALSPKSKASIGAANSKPVYVYYD